MLMASYVLLVHGAVKIHLHRPCLLNLLDIDTVLSVTKDTTSDGHCMKYSENCSLR